MRNLSYDFEWQLYNPILCSVVFCWYSGGDKQEIYNYLN